jgi:Spy/CpxP family protein refolding chaperone
MTYLVNLMRSRPARVVRGLVVVTAVLATVMPTTRAVAQSASHPRSAGRVAGPRMRPPPQPRPRRPMVEKLQQRVDDVLRNRLQLNDEQFNKLRDMNARLNAERIGIRQEENATRRELRQQLAPGNTPDDARVSELLDRLPQIDRKRIALQEKEQKELAGFLQPAQRARYFALQDELRRSLQDVQRNRQPGDSAGGSQMRGRGGRSEPPPFPN